MKYIQTFNSVFDDSFSDFKTNLSELLDGLTYNVQCIAEEFVTILITTDKYEYSVDIYPEDVLFRSDIWVFSVEPNKATAYIMSPVLFHEYVNELVIFAEQKWKRNAN